MWSAAQLALLREAGIAGTSVSAGLNALRKANYASPGIYSHAFFSMSIGLERTMKLIYLLDFKLESGTYPTDRDLRNLGHDIEVLFSRISEIKSRRSLRSGPSAITGGSIEMYIIEFMSRFARRSRYYNLDYLVGSPRAATDEDPIKDWFKTVGKSILDKHLTQKMEAEIKHRARALNTSFGDFMSVAFTAEDGSAIEDLYSATYQDAITEIVRKYSTFYSARICRYLYYILYDINHLCLNDGTDVPHLYELFFPFMNKDKYLLGRKTFPTLGQ